MPNSIEKWKTHSLHPAGNFKIFDIAIARRQSPRHGRESDFVVIDSPQWVNIIPITRQNTVILVQQYRHGIDDITLEVPGGLVDAGEEPCLAAMRECREETGFAANIEAELLGVNQPNPAFLNNHCYSYLWRGCERVQEQQLDGNEDISVHEVPITDIPALIKDGSIRHSLVLTAFLYYSLRYSFS